MALVSLRYPVNDGEPEPKTAHLSSAIRFQPVEWKHHFLVHILGDTGAIVVNCYADLACFLRKLKQDFTIGIPNRVSEKVLVRSQEESFVSKYMDTRR